VTARPRLFLLRAFAYVALASAALAATTTGCKKDPTTSETAPEPPRVDDATTGLLLTWVDDKGEFHTEERVTDVPADAREVVRVRDPNKEEPAGGRVFVADLRALGPNGVYPVRAVAREEFENVAVARRAKHGNVLAPKAPASASAGANGGADVAARPAVIIYGASWCGPCHQAAAYLKQRGIAFVEHDIEKDSLAAREMQAKLAKAGVRGGSIPVLDVRGTILVGFDARAVDRALAL